MQVNVLVVHTGEVFECPTEPVCTLWKRHVFRWESHLTRQSLTASAVTATGTVCNGLLVTHTHGAGWRHSKRHIS
jgi:hypothetical protein